MSSETTPRAIASSRIRRAQQDPTWVRLGLIALALSVVGVLVVIPLVNIFVQAFSEGVSAYWRNLFGDSDTRHSILLTLIVAPTALVANVIFGIASAWAV